MDPSYKNSFGGQAPIVSGPISSGSTGTISSGSTGGQAGAFGPAPLSSGTGDIILGSGKQAKSKKPIIIAAISVVVVLVVALAILVISTLSRPATTRELFNEYANYLLFGTESRADLSDDEYEWGKLYYAGKQRVSLTGQSENDNIKKQYLDGLKNKYEKFKKSVSLDALGEYDDDFYMFYYAYRYPVVTYTKNSTEDDVEKIKEQYNIYINSDNTAVQEYGTALMQNINGDSHTETLNINDLIINIFSKLWKIKEAIYAQE